MGGRALSSFASASLSPDGVPSSTEVSEDPPHINTQGWENAPRGHARHRCASVEHCGEQHRRSAMQHTQCIEHTRRYRAPIAHVTSGVTNGQPTPVTASVRSHRVRLRWQHAQLTESGRAAPTLFVALDIRVAHHTPVARVRARRTRHLRDRPVSTQRPPARRRWRPRRAVGRAADVARST